MALSLTRPAPAVAFWCVVAVFLVYALNLALLSGDFERFAARWLQRPGAGATGHDLGCDTINTCMRAGVTVLGEGLSTLFSGAAALLYMAPSTSALLPSSPFGMPVPPADEQLFAVRVATFIVLRVICLLPVLWLAVYFWREAWARIAYLTLAFLVMAGWPPPVIDVFFRAASVIADWPLAYYLFSVRLIGYDFATLGFVHLLALYIARRGEMRLVEIAALTALGQIMFENNGIVAGVAVFAATFLEPAHAGTRLRLATQRLAVAAAVSVTLATAFAIAASRTAAGAAGNGSGAVDMINDYFSTFWRDYGFYNFAWFNVTVANIATMMTIPAVLGLGAGVIIGAVVRRDGPSRPRVPGDARAALAVAVGFSVTVLIGLFISGLSSEMGRQLLPLACMVLVAAMKGGEAALNRRGAS
jgi:hypothetical protein